MKISLLIAVYNAEAWLGECLESLLAQTHADWEALCVDDASTDGSWTILQQYAQHDERFHLFHLTENQGQAHARNVALSHAGGELICMLDADDTLSPDALALANEAFTLHPQADIAVLGLLLAYPDGRLTPHPANLGYPLTGPEAFTLALTWRLHGLYVVRADLHQRFPYDESCRLYADDNTSRLHYLHARKVVPCQGQYLYCQHSVSSTHALTPSRFLYLEANLSLKRQLDALAESDELGLGKAFWTRTFRTLEEHRWRNLIAHYILFQQHKTSFTPEERADIEARLQRIFSTIERRRLPLRFFLRPRFLPWPSYRLFALWQDACTHLSSPLRHKKQFPADAMPTGN